VVEAPLESLTDVDWTLLLEKTYQKKYGMTPPRNERERAARGRYLLRRGFEGDAIRRLFRQLSQVGVGNDFFNETEDG
jgi:SOS response regulatory protein OraA/RecX